MFQLFFPLPLRSESASDLPPIEGMVLKNDEHFLLLLKAMGHTTLTYERTKPTIRQEKEWKWLKWERATVLLK